MINTNQTLNYAERYNEIARICNMMKQKKEPDDLSELMDNTMHSGQGFMFDDEYENL